MRGLIWKDFFMLGKSLRLYVMMVILYCAIALFSGDATFLFSFMSVLLMILPISAFSYDEQVHWDSYAACLPTGRRTIVRARYAFILLLTALAALIDLGYLAVMALTNRGSLAEQAASLLASLLVALAIPCILLPINYKLGPEKARIFYFLVIGVPLVLFLLAAKVLGPYITIPQLTPAMVSFGLLGFAIVLVVGLMVSYRISVWIYEQKEF